jgi:uncharacterized damage-inducible protein DinB
MPAAPKSLRGFQRRPHSIPAIPFPLTEYTMKNTLYALAVCTSVVAAVASARAEDPKGFRADLIGQVEYVQKQILDLENAIPDAKMTWRPNKDVRSISEVYSHVAFSTYMLLQFAGVKLPDGITITTPGDATKWETASTDKKVIRDQLMKSFEFAKSSIAGMSDASLENMVDFFGQKMTVRSVLLVLLSHMHEHLGQSIAYARMEGIEPPWTAAQKAAEKTKN